MRSLFTSLALSLVFMPFTANAQVEPSCTQTMQQISATPQEMSQGQREKVNKCYTFCEKIANYPNARTFCGVDDCLVESASGAVSTWCCKMAKFWGNKQGALENPLEALVDKCNSTASGQRDYMYCIADFQHNSKMTEECCTLLPEINKYDSVLGKSITSYCSEKKAAQACREEFENGGVMTKACCSFARANSQKFTGTKAFANDELTAEKLQGAITSCNVINTREDLDLSTCRNKYFVTFQFNKECCAAFEKGILVPDRLGMNYTALDKYCNPDNYRY